MSPFAPRKNALTSGDLIVGLFSALKKMFAGSPGPKKRKVPPRSNIEKRFDLRGRTGQGSMSKVYQAYDNKLGRTVCLKVMDKEKTKKFEERFKGMHKP